jgi:hypothetical protein
MTSALFLRRDQAIPKPEKANINALVVPTSQAKQTQIHYSPSFGNL